MALLSPDPPPRPRFRAFRRRFLLSEMWEFISNFSGFNQSDKEFYRAKHVLSPFD